jgi:hypothetical protein
MREGKDPEYQSIYSGGKNLVILAVKIFFR